MWSTDGVPDTVFRNANRVAICERKVKLAGMEAGCIVA
jgi:hypothetical protein